MIKRSFIFLLYYFSSHSKHEDLKNFVQRQMGIKLDSAKSTFSGCELAHMKFTVGYSKTWDSS